MTQKTSIRNPYWRGLIPISALTTLFGFITLALYGLAALGVVNAAISIIGIIFTAFFGLMVVIIWLAGLVQKGKIRRFLASDRPAIYWTYSQTEWSQIKTENWQEEHHDWKIQLGCLTALLAMAGLLTGLMIGAEDGLMPAIVTGLAGLAVGMTIGSILGGTVAASNHLTAVWAWKRGLPGKVALGPGEIYANEQYFRTKGRQSFIMAAELNPGRPAMLEIQLKMPPRVRMPDEETWEIPVPADRVAEVETFLPGLMASEEPS